MEGESSFIPEIKEDEPRIDFPAKANEVLNSISENSDYHAEWEAKPFVDLGIEKIKKKRNCHCV